MSLSVGVQGGSLDKFKSGPLTHLIQRVPGDSCRISQPNSNVRRLGGFESANFLTVRGGSSKTDGQRPCRLVAGQGKHILWPFCAVCGEEKC